MSRSERPFKRAMNAASLETSVTDKSRSSETFYGIQALRAVAALLVVLEHSIYLWLARVAHTPEAKFWMNGVTGVDIFFVISGFVMTLSLPGLTRHRHPVRVFLRRRVSRIVPLYWLATTSKILLVLAVPALALHQTLTFPNIVGSYLFVPVLNGENVLVPVIVVGWTLNFEMFFYLIFSLTMLFRRNMMTVLVPALSGIATLGIFANPSWLPIFTLASPLLFEFLFGVGVAQLSMARRLPSRVASLCLVVIGFLIILACFPQVATDLQLGKFRFLLWGLPASAVVLGMVGLERTVHDFIPRWLLSLGNASYAIYLVQTFVLPLVGVIVIKLHLFGMPALAVCIVGGLLFSSLSGELAHRYVEVPILARLKGKQQRGAGFVN